MIRTFEGSLHCIYKVISRYIDICGGHWGEMTPHHGCNIKTLMTHPCTSLTQYEAPSPLHEGFRLTGSIPPQTLKHRTRQYIKKRHSFAVFQYNTQRTTCAASGSLTVSVLQISCRAQRKNIKHEAHRVFGRQRVVHFGQTDVHHVVFFWETGG